MKNPVAIIDLGTNTVHLLIVGQGGLANILYSEKQAVKIGMGGITKRIITSSAVQRTMHCLYQYKNIMLEWKVGQVLAIGTSALRQAKNRIEIIKKIKSEIGIDLRVITGLQEAEYIYFGVRQAVKLGMNRSLIMDIGGGSVEFIIANEQQIFWKNSFEIGAQFLLELYQFHDPIYREEILEIETHFGRSLSALKIALQKWNPEVLVGSSGTFDTLSSIYMSRPTSATISMLETPLDIASFYVIYEQIKVQNRTQRMQIIGMSDLRVDMIVVASSLIHYVLSMHRFTSIRVSAYALKEGLYMKDGNF